MTRSLSKRDYSAVVIAIAVIGTAIPLLEQSAVGSTVSPGGTVEIPVSFDVVNKNDSAMPCPSDGAPYVVKGHLVGPHAELTGPPRHGRVVTLLLTGNDEAEWTWRFKAVPGYDYSFEMAKLGHTSLSIDMLGYRASGRPHGFLACWGSQADVNHQIVQQLKAGAYRVLDKRFAPTSFATVLVTGRDTGPLVAIIQAYTWPDDIAGLSTEIWAHQGATPYIIDILARRIAACSLGGQGADDAKDDPDDLTDDPSRGGGYMWVGPPDEEFRTDLFSEKRADPNVIDAVIGLRNRNPCGHLQWVSAAIRRNLMSMKDVKIPALLVFPGPEDPVFSRSGQESEAANYGSTDVMTAWMDSGHFTELESCAPAFRALHARWVYERWGVGKNVASPAVGPSECVTEVRVKGR